MTHEDSPYRTADHAPCVGDSEYRCPMKTRIKDYYRKKVLEMNMCGSMKALEMNMCGSMNQNMKANILTMMVGYVIIMTSEINR